MLLIDEEKLSDNTKKNILIDLGYNTNGCSFGDDKLWLEYMEKSKDIIIEDGINKLKNEIDAKKYVNKWIDELNIYNLSLGKKCSLIRDFIYDIWDAYYHDVPVEKRKFNQDDFLDRIKWVTGRCRAIKYKEDSQIYYDTDRQISDYWIDELAKTM